MNAAEKLTIATHPAAEIFPLMQGADFDALVADMRDHGQREPIILYGGAILDGRNRHRACVEVGIDPTFLEWHGEGTPEAFVISMNLHRRHLDASQRAMVAAKIAKMRPGFRTDLKPTADLPEVSRSRAAELLNVGERTVGAARIVVRDGTQEEVDAVERGDVAVTVAARAIRARKKTDDAPIPSAPKAPWIKVKLKDGLTMEDVCRQGLTLEAAGASNENAADRIGLARLSYSKMRDIVLLADRSDLRPADAELTKRALAEMNSSQQVIGAYEIIEPLKTRVWGTQRGSRANLEANRLDAFERAFGALIQVCSSAPEIEIPYLSIQRATEALEELSSAEKLVREFRNRLREMCQ